MTYKYKDYSKCEPYITMIKETFMSNTGRLTRFKVVEYLEENTNITFKRAIRVAIIMWLEGMIKE